MPQTMQSPPLVTLPPGTPTTRKVKAATAGGVAGFSLGSLLSAAVAAEIKRRSSIDVSPETLMVIMWAVDPGLAIVVGALSAWWAGWQTRDRKVVPAPVEDRNTPTAHRP